MSKASAAFKTLPKLKIKKAMQMNHEFLDDEAVIQAKFDPKSYLYLLLQKATNMQGSLLTSNFNFSTTKTRLIMMTKVASKRIIRTKQLAIIPILFLIMYLFSEKTIGRSTFKTEIKKSNKISFDSTKREIPFSVKGLEMKELEEYQNLLFANMKFGKTRAGNSFLYPDNSIVPKLESYFIRMSKEQQNNQDFIFVTVPLLPKITPTKSEFESFKNSKKYGVWIDDKKVDNSKLNKYRNTDFDQFFISKLYANARKNVSYFYQLDMMTKSYYQKYYNDGILDKRTFIISNRNKSGKDLYEKYYKNSIK